LTEEPPPEGRRKVRRGEGEVTEWPRGLVDYLPTGEPEQTPSPEEDRDLNRLRLASRLLGFAQAQGLTVDEFVRRLREADRAFREGNRAAGRRVVDEVIAEVETLVDRRGASGNPPS
jgi:hypothetical protein